jgi:hypothetical protein
MSRNVREAYGFLANNYRVGDTPEESDEIFLFGFSRGFAHNNNPQNADYDIDDADAGATLFEVFAA